MTTTAAAIANHLNIVESIIAEVQEWANVLWVRFVGRRPRFVSKKALTMNTDTQLPELTGSEKQVTWAQDLRGSLIQSHQSWVEWITAKNAKLESKGKGEAVAKNVAEMTKTATKLSTILTNCQSASWWIHNRKNCATDNAAYGADCVASMYIAGYSQGQF
jgi:hypothetical protein